MEQELAIKLQDNGITYLYLTIDVFATSLVWLEVVGTPGDPFASFDLAMFGVAQIVSGLSCCGRVMSDVVCSGWTRVTRLGTVGDVSAGSVCNLRSMSHDCR